MQNWELAGRARLAAQAAAEGRASALGAVVAEGSAGLRSLREG